LIEEAGMPKVLIVDDSAFLRSRLCKLLGEHGYQTIQAEDGVQAVDMYRTERPDVVLMDITMPNMNGMDALMRIRMQDSQARVIMLTALDQKLVAARAVHMGAKDFLVKPVMPTKLLLSIQKALR